MWFYKRLQHTACPTTPVIKLAKMLRYLRRSGYNIDGSFKGLWLPHPWTNYSQTWGLWPQHKNPASNKKFPYKPQTTSGSKFSAWLEILLGVPQGSILGPLLFNIFINDIFLFIFETYICNFADDTTIYACDTNLSMCRSRLEKDITTAIKWYTKNELLHRYFSMILTKTPFFIEHLWVTASKHPWLHILVTMNLYSYGDKKSLK